MKKHVLNSVVRLGIGLVISGLGVPGPRDTTGSMWPVGLTGSAQAQVVLPQIEVNGANLVYFYNPGASYDFGFGSSGYAWPGGGLGSWGGAFGPRGGSFNIINGSSYSGLSTASIQAQIGNPGSNGVGDPIDIATGNAYETETDYTTIGGFPLVLTRYYNSLESSGLHELGNNWHMSYGRSISVRGSTAAVTRDDGHVLTFTASSGVWSPPVYANFRLTQTPSGFSLVTDQDETETYSSAGKLLSYANRAGLKLTFTYDGQSRLAMASDAYGRTLSFSYNSSSFISQVQAPDHGVYSYGYDSSNRLISVTYPDGSKRQYLYEYGASSNQLTGIVDENGSRYATYFYWGERAVTTQHAGGADRFVVSALSYTFEGQWRGFAMVTTPNLGFHNYNFRGVNGVAKQFADWRACACPTGGGGSAAYSYDGNGNLTSYSDFKGNQTSFSYDTTRNLPTAWTLASGTAVARGFKATWHPKFRLPTQIVDGARTFNFSYDGTGNLLTASLVSGSMTSTNAYTYNSAGQVLTAKDPAGNVTTYAYDTKGNLASVTNTLGQVTSITNYDASGRPLKILDANGVVTNLAYNWRGQVTSRVTLGQATTYLYDKVGQLVRLSLPSGAVVNFSYDAAHRLVGIVDGLGNKIALTLDRAGNRIKTDVYDASGVLVRTHSRTYDRLGRLYQDIGAAGQTSTFSYDDNSNLVGVQDPNGNAIALAYDAQNRLSQKTDPCTLGGGSTCSSGSPGPQTNYAYDANGRLRTVTDPRGHVTTYTYNALGEPTAIASPDTRTTTNTFDAAGNVRTSTDARGQTTTYTYDALNRLVKAIYADGFTASYGYDQGAHGIGRLTSMSDWTGTTTWAYDAYGHVVQKSQKTGAVTLTTKWSYKPANGLLASMTYPSGYMVFYGYDADARVNALQLQPPGGAAATFIGSIAYRPFGTIASWSQIASGGSYSRAFDLDGRITGITSSTGAASSYAYDSGSRLTSIAESGLATKTFSYDHNDRLTGYVYGPGSIAYAYDLSGNRTSDGQNTYSTDSGSNRLLELTGRGGLLTSFPYDSDGAMTSNASGISLAYDARHRLSRAIVGALVTNYGVNVLGQRVSKSGPLSGAVEYVYDLSGRLLGSYGASGAAQEEIVWLGALPVASLQNGAAYYIAPDHLGASHRIINTANQQVWFWDHDPFGQSGPTTTVGLKHNLRFPGQIYDPETGLHNNGFRDYSPALGRYVESDPIGLAGGINTYAYVDNDPVNAIDPFGLDPEQKTSTYLSFIDLEKIWRDIGDDPWGSIQAGLDGLGPIGAIGAGSIRIAGRFAAKEAPALGRGLTYLYQKVGVAGQHLKFGITNNPATRYTSEELAGGRLKIIAQGARKEMLQLERNLHETLPIGPEEGQSFYIQKQIEKGLTPPPYNP